MDLEGGHKEITPENIWGEEKLNAIDKFVENHKAKQKSVFIIEAHYFDSWFIHRICATKEKSEEEEENLLRKIQNIKTTYWLEFDSEYDEDIKDDYQDHLLETDDKKYDEVNHRIYTYQMVHPELTIEDIKITEHKVV